MAACLRSRLCPPKNLNALHIFPLAPTPMQRFLHVIATPSTSSIHPPTDLSEQTRAIPKLSGNGPFPQEIQFEVLGSPFSLLSVSLPSSSTLYTRRGTLVGVNGKIENATSTLALLEPFRRALLGIPFLYQKVSSITPLTCLVSTNSLNSSFAVIKLDGKVDWRIVEKKALLAWAGHTLIVKPALSQNLSLARWGNSKVMGRGLVALVGRGQVFQIVLQPGEQYLVHPSNLLAYSLNTQQPPKLYHLPPNALRLQVPSLGFSRLISKIKVFRKAVESEAYRTILRFISKFRRWIQETILGDRQLLQFEGPVTILVQSRSKRMRDIFTKEEVDDTPLVEPDAALQVVSSATGAKSGKAAPEKESWRQAHCLRTKVAFVDKSGKVKLADSDLNEFVRP